MFKKIIISFILINFYTNRASEERTSSPVKEVYFSVCQSTGVAAHADCVLSTQCSQRCIGCRKWDMLFSESKKDCDLFKVNFASKCVICEKLLVQATVDK